VAARPPFNVAVAVQSRSRCVAVAHYHGLGSALVKMSAMLSSVLMGWMSMRRVDELAQLEQAHGVVLV
jgi:hypothetical protein